MSEKKTNEELEGQVDLDVARIGASPSEARLIDEIDRLQALLSNQRVTSPERPVGVEETEDENFNPYRLADINKRYRNIPVGPFDEPPWHADVRCLLAHVAHLEESLAKLRSAYDAGIGALIVRLKRGIRIEVDCPPGHSILLINPTDGESKDVVVSREVVNGL